MSRARKIPAAAALLACVLVRVTAAHGEFSTDQYPQRPDILERLIAAAEASGDPLAPGVRKDTTYYLRRAEYVGSCEAPFGRVHVAQFFYTRSARQGSTAPARGHGYVLFFDASLRLRGRWDLDQPLSGLAVDGTRLRLGQRTVVDFARPPDRDSVIVDGKPQAVPRWATR